MKAVFRFSWVQIKIGKDKWRIDLTDDEGNLKEKMYCLDINDIIGLELYDYDNEVELRIFTKSSGSFIRFTLFKWDDATPEEVMEKNIKVRKEFSNYFFNKVEKF